MLIIRHWHAPLVHLGNDGLTGILLVGYSQSYIVLIMNNVLTVFTWVCSYSYLHVRGHSGIKSQRCNHINAILSIEGARSKTVIHNVKWFNFCICVSMIVIQGDQVMIRSLYSSSYAGHRLKHVIWSYSIISCVKKELWLGYLWLN